MPNPSTPPLLLVDAAGARVGIDLGGADAIMRAAVVEAWSGARSSSPGAPDVVVTLPAVHTVEQMLARLSMDVTRAAIGARSGRAWLLHASGLAAPDGRVVVLVGRSGAGKTTATRVLAQEWGYVSDETVGIEADGTVLPYRKPLSIITTGHDVKVQHAPADLGLLPLPSERLRVARVIVLDRRADGSPARLEPEGLSTVLADLASNSSGLASMTTPLTTLSRIVARTGGVLRARYTDAHELVPLIAELFASVAAPLDDVDEAVAADAPVERLDPSAPVVDRTPFVDACGLDGGRLAILSSADGGDAQLRVLDGIAPSIWRAAARADRRLIVEAVERRHGAPPCEGDAERLVDAAIEELRREGLVTVTR